MEKQTLFVLSNFDQVLGIFPDISGAVIVKQFLEAFENVSELTIQESVFIPRLGSVQEGLLITKPTIPSDKMPSTIRGVLDIKSNLAYFNSSLENMRHTIESLCDYIDAVVVRGERRDFSTLRVHKK